jgi:transcriptional regulator with XRE-family HTH domain
MTRHKEIKKRREYLKLTQEDVSFATEIDQSLYSKIERGVSKASEGKLKAIFKYLRIKK